MNNFARFSLVSLAALGGAAAQAQEASSIETIMAAVDLSTITGSVVAAGLVVVAIALAFKGPTLAKRVISKV